MTLGAELQLRKLQYINYTYNHFIFHREILRNALMEKQTDLEGSLLKYKTDLTTANSNIAAKDLIISKLQMQVLLVTLWDYDLIFLFLKKS